MIYILEPGEVTARITGVDSSNLGGFVCLWAILLDDLADEKREMTGGIVLAVLRPLDGQQRPTRRRDGYGQALRQKDVTFSMQKDNRAKTLGFKTVGLTVWLLWQRSAHVLNACF